MAVEKCLSAVLRSVRVAATYEKVGLTPRCSRASHLSIFEQPQNMGVFIDYSAVTKVLNDADKNLYFQDLIL
jgi:hypothetical protein